MIGTYELHFVDQKSLKMATSNGILQHKYNIIGDNIL